MSKSVKLLPPALQALSLALLLPAVATSVAVAAPGASAPTSAPTSAPAPASASSATSQTVAQFSNSPYSNYTLNNGMSLEEYRHTIDPEYQAAAINMLSSYENYAAINKFNELTKEGHKFTTIKPDLIYVPSASDGFKLEVAIYRPQNCTEDSPTCPLFTGYDMLYPRYLQEQAERGLNIKPATEDVVVIGDKDEAATTATTATTEQELTGQPLILFSYAGGFLLRLNYYKMIANTAQAIVAVPRYRLSQEHPFPAPVIDNYSALGYLLNNAAEYNIDTKQVFLMGESAGGGLSAALALYNRDHNNYPIKAQILIYPMLDFRTGSKDSLYNAPMLGQVAWSGKDNSFAWREYGHAQVIAALSGTILSRTMPDKGQSASMQEATNAAREAALATPLNHRNGLGVTRLNVLQNPKTAADDELNVDKVIIESDESTSAAISVADVVATAGAEGDIPSHADVHDNINTKANPFANLSQAATDVIDEFSQYHDRAEKLATLHESHKLKANNKSAPDYLSYYSPSVARDLSNLPPAFIYVGDRDLFANESLRYASDLLQAGINVELHLAPGLYHLFEQVNPDGEQSKRYYNTLFHFIDQRLIDNW